MRHPLLGSGLVLVGVEEGDAGFDEGAGFGAGNGEFAAELADAFAHAADADSEVDGIYSGGDFGREAFAVIANADGDHIGLFVHFHAGVFALGMLVDVGEGLLNYAENSGFEIGLKARKYWRGDGQGNLDLAALGEALDIPMQRGTQTGFVEERRVQQVREIANGGDEGVHIFVEAFVGVGFGQEHLEADQLLTKVVVKLASETAALLILNLQELGGEFLEFDGAQLNDAPGFIEVRQAVAKFAI